MKIDNKAGLPKPGRLGRALAALTLATAAFAAPLAVYAKDPLIPPGAVLALINNVQIDDQAETFELEDGVVSNFWYGREIDLGGKHYYATFSWFTRDRAAREGEDFIAPDVKVRLADATFELARPGQKQPYDIRSIERKIGFFGAREQPEEVDTSRQALEYRTNDGRLVLAVPTATFDSGYGISGYAVFVFNPNKTPEEDGWVWSYLGQVFSGEDNSAACDDGTVIPCIANQGELNFVAAQGPMPRLLVKFSGTTSAGDTQTRKMGDADDVSYVFDGKQVQYVRQ